MFKKITLINTFHNTRMNIMVKSGQTFGEYITELESIIHFSYITDRDYLSAKRKLNHIKNTLCGIKECKCGAFTKQDV